MWFYPNIRRLFSFMDVFGTATLVRVENYLKQTRIFGAKK